MSARVWLVVRDNNDSCGCGCPGCGRGSEVLAVYTVDEMARATVEELNVVAAGRGAPERFRAVRVDLNSSDRLPGQWVESSTEVMRGVFAELWQVTDYVPLEALRTHRPEWQSWPTVAGVRR